MEPNSVAGLISRNETRLRDNSRSRQPLAGLIGDFGYASLRVSPFAGRPRALRNAAAWRRGWPQCCCMDM